MVRTKMQNVDSRFGFGPELLYVLNFQGTSLEGDINSYFGFFTA